MRPLVPGDRVQMVGIMPDDPDPIPVGSIGTVRSLLFAGRQIVVEWDDLDRSLMLLDTDPYRILDRRAEP